MNKKKVNEYLFYEFGFDLQGDESSISDEWPFQLVPVGSIWLRGELIDFFEFRDRNDDYFATEGDYFPKSGMTLEEFAIQDTGSQWIGSQNPVDLNTTVIGDDLVPRIAERRENFEVLAKKALGDNAKYSVIEGLFLRKTGTYLALLQIGETADAIVVGSEIEPLKVGFPKASIYRRLSYAVGKILQEEMKS